MLFMNNVSQSILAVLEERESRFIHKHPTLNETQWDTEQAAETWAVPLGPAPSNKPSLQTWNKSAQTSDQQDRQTDGWDRGSSLPI